MTECRTDNELLDYCGDDAAKWAEQFRKTAVELGYSDMDEGDFASKSTEPNKGKQQHD